MAKRKPKRSKPAKASPPPSLAELTEKAQRIQAQTEKTVRQLMVIQEEILISRMRAAERKRT